MTDEYTDEQLIAVAKWAGVDTEFFSYCVGGEERHPVPFDEIWDTTTWVEGLEAELLSPAGTVAILGQSHKEGRFRECAEMVYQQMLDHSAPDLPHAVLAAAVKLMEAKDENQRYF
jgi:hypothetical protein